MKNFRNITEFRGRISATEEAHVSRLIWGTAPIELRWQALREMLAFYYDRDPDDENPFPVDRSIEEFGSLRSRWVPQ